MNANAALSVQRKASEGWKVQVRVVFANFTFKRMQNSFVYRRTPMRRHTDTRDLLFLLLPTTCSIRNAIARQEAAGFDKRRVKWRHMDTPLPHRLSPFLQYLTSSFKDGSAISVRLTGTLHKPRYYYTLFHVAENTKRDWPDSPGSRKYRCALFGNNLYRGRLRVKMRFKHSWPTSVRDAHWTRR